MFDVINMVQKGRRIINKRKASTSNSLLNFLLVEVLYSTNMIITTKHVLDNTKC